MSHRGVAVSKESLEEDSLLDSIGVGPVRKEEELGWLSRYPFFLWRSREKGCGLSWVVVAIIGLGCTATLPPHPSPPQPQAL